MSAQIIQFPRKTPLEWHELPDDWSERLKRHYVHVTYSGFNSHQDAFAYCQIMAAVPPQAKGESDSAYLLRKARAAIGALEPLKEG